MSDPNYQRGPASSPASGRWNPARSTAPYCRLAAPDSRRSGNRKRPSGARALTRRRCRTPHDRHLSDRSSDLSPHVVRHARASVGGAQEHIARVRPPLAYVLGDRECLITAEINNRVRSGAVSVKPDKPALNPTDKHAGAELGRPRPVLDGPILGHDRCFERRFPQRSFFIEEEAEVLHQVQPLALRHLRDTAGSRTGEASAKEQSALVGLAAAAVVLRCRTPFRAALRDGSAGRRPCPSRITRPVRSG